MATTLSVRMEATIIDELGVQARTNVYALVDPGASFTDIITVYNTWLANLDACTDGQIVRGELVVTPDLPGGLKSAPVTGSRVEQTGMIAFRANSTTHQWATAIPALSSSPTVISAGKIVLDDGDPIPVYVLLLLEGGTASLVWTNATSQALTYFSNALLSFRRYNYQLARETYERTS